MVGRASLVGRDRELAILRDALMTAGTGRGQVVSISGEPGVGKTTVVRAFAEAARADGARVLWGTCFEGEAQASFGPWQTVLAALGLTQLVDIQGELRPPEARAKLFSAVVDALGREAAGSAVVIVLDDLHWATSDSLGLYTFVAERSEQSGVLLVGTYRDPDPALESSGALSRAMAGVVRLSGYAHVQLRGLDRDDVAEMIDMAFGDVVPRAITKAVFEQTSGNPFYVGEVAKLLSEEGKLVQREGRWLSDFSITDLGIPATVRHAVRGRMANLSPPAHDLLLAASVFTGDVDLETVRFVAELDDLTALDAVDEALAGGLLQRTGVATTPYTFAHAIVRHTVTDMLNPDRAARLHRRAAEALEAIHPQRRAAIGEQFLLSRSIPGAEEGVTHLVAAAADAASQHASQQAARLLELALELVPTPATALRTDLLCRLAVAQAEALDHTQAPLTVDRVLPSVSPSDAADLIVTVTEALREGAPNHTWEPLVHRGLALLGDDHGVTWARLTIAIDPVEAVATGPFHAGRWVGYPPDAVAALRSSGTEDDRARAIEPFKPRTEVETEAIEREADAWVSTRARIRCLDLAGRDFSLRHGRTVDAVRCYDELLRLGERSGSLPARAEALGQLALCLALLGDIDGAEDHLRRHGDLVGDIWPGHRLRLLGTLSSSAIVSYMVGEGPWNAMAARLEAFVTTPAAGRAPFANVFIALAALCHALAGDGARSSAITTDLVGTLARMDTLDHAVAGSMWFLAAAIWQRRDAEAAHVLATLLSAHQHAGGPPGPVPTLDDAAGRMAALLGDEERATRLLRRAADRFDAAGARGVAALARFDLAGISREPAQLEAAARTFEELGMRGWAARTGSGTAAPAPPRPAGLSPREVEVLQLLAAGKTSKEIAATLVLSLLTVNRHIANIYTKIGARNRSEATAFAIAQRLVHSSL